MNFLESLFRSSSSHRYHQQDHRTAKTLQHCSAYLPVREVWQFQMRAKKDDQAIRTGCQCASREEEEEAGGRREVTAPL